MPGLDAAGMGAELCANPKVAKITFTGSTRVGKILMRQGADTIKELSLELGATRPSSSSMTLTWTRRSRAP